MRKGRNEKIAMVVLLVPVFILSATCTESDNVQNTEPKAETILPDAAPVIGGQDTEYIETGTDTILPEETLVIGGHKLDPYLKKQFSKRLEIGPGRCADLEGVGQLENATNLVLSIKADNFHDFSPLRQLSKLESLMIYGNLREIPDLSGLPALKDLTIEVDDVRDFSPLRRLSKLESLMIDGNLREIPDLSGLPALKELMFDNASLSSLEGLERTPQLTEFTISFNKVPVTDTTALRHLKDLKYLRFMYGAYNIDLHDLSMLPGLEELLFYGCGTIDLSGIGQLQSLKRLVLYSNAHHDLKERSVYLNMEEIGALTGLMEISIDESISSVEFLAGNSNLESIILFADKEREDYGHPDRFLPLDVSPLRNLKKLSHFFVMGFALENVDALERVGIVPIEHYR